MALSIGTLVGYLQLDDTTFSRKADAADRRMDALKLHLAALAKVNPKIQVDVTTQTARLDELKAKIAELRVKAAEGVDVKVDMVAALVELEAVKAKLREIGNAARDDEAKVGRLAAASEALGKVKGPSLLWTAILGLGPALVPLAGAATVAFGAFGTAALGAVAGIGVLKLALSGIGSQVKAYQAYTAAMAKATTAAQRTAARNALDRSAYGTAPGQSQAFARYAATALPAVRAGATNAAEVSFLPGLTAGLKAAVPLMGTVDKAIGRIGTTLGGLADKAGHALSSPFWKQFFGWLGTTAASDLKLIGSIGGNVFTALARAIQGFGPDGTKLLTWIDGLAKKFNGWTAGKGFSAFMATIRADANQAVSMFQKLAPSVAAFLKGFASAGPGTFTAVGALLTIIAAMPPGVLAAIGKYLPIFVLSLKGMQIAGAVAKGIKAIAEAEKVWAAAQAVLNFITEQFPLVAIITVAIVAILLIIKYHKQLQHAVEVAWNAIKAAGLAAWHWIESAAVGAYNTVKNGIVGVVNWIKSHWALLVSIIGGPLGAVVALVITHWSKITGAASRAWGYLRSFGSWISSTFVGIWNAVLGAIQNVISWIGNIPGHVASALHSLAGPFGGVLHFLHVPGFATGTNDALGGLSILGENGPEAVVLPQHAKVLNHAQTMALGAQRAGSGGPVELSDASIQKLATAILAGSKNVAQSTVLSESKYAAMIGGR